MRAFASACGLEGFLSAREQKSGPNRPATTSPARLRSKSLIRVHNRKPSFDPLSKFHPPVESLPVETPTEVWRPTIAPRPLSPLRQLGRLESDFSTSGSKSFSSSNSRNKVVAASEAKGKADKSGGWSLGRAFQPKEIAAFELNTHLLNEWLTSYNDEQRSYRSLSTKIETELREASVFANALPKPNMLVTAVALTSLDRLGQLFGRYRGLFGSIREILIGCMYEDSEAILAEERDVHKRTLTVKEFSQHVPYFTALHHHKLQLGEVQDQMVELRKLIEAQQQTEKRRSSRMVAEMWKNAAVKSTAKNNQSLLAQRLKETEDSLQSLHTSMHADTHGSIMQMMGRLNHQEASSILQSLVPLLGGGEVGILLAQILRDARGFKSSDALHLVEGLTQIMISSDQIMLFPNCSELLPNATAYRGTLALLKNMKAGDRDTLIGELYEGLENGPRRSSNSCATSSWKAKMVVSWNC